MTQEDYVSFEVAKLLKEKGYNKKCNAVWETGVCRECSPKLKITLGVYDEKDLMHNVDWSEQYEYLAPSLWDAQKWLREKGFEVESIFEKGRNQWFYIAQSMNTDSFLGSVSDVWYDTYEQALNEGIKEALEMI